MFKRAVSFIFLTFLVVNNYSQENWNRYSWGTPDREGFTVLLPIVPRAIVTGTDWQGISADNDNNSLFKDEFDYSSTIRPLKPYLAYNVLFIDGVTRREFDQEIEKWANFTGQQPGGQGTGTPKAERERELNLNRQVTEISICGYPGIEFGNSNSIQQFFLINNRLYHLWVTGANKSSPGVQKFLNSFTLINPWQEWKGKRVNDIGKDSGIGNGRSITFESAVCQKIGTSEIKPKTPEIKKEIVKLPANSPFRIISKPRAIYPEELKPKGVQGTVTLRVTFLKDGTIGKVSVVKGVDKLLDASTVKAAKLIRFEPQRSKGQAITITRLVQYTFTLY